MGYQMVTRPMTSRDPEMAKTCDHKTLRAQYLKNSWKDAI